MLECSKTQVCGRRAKVVLELDQGGNTIGLTRHTKNAGAELWCHEEIPTKWCLKVIGKRDMQKRPGPTSLRKVTSYSFAGASADRVGS
jgi:hypothetical protein